MNEILYRGIEIDDLTNGFNKSQTQPTDQSVSITPQNYDPAGLRCN